MKSFTTMAMNAMSASTNDLASLDPNGQHPDGRPFMFHERMLIEKLNHPEKTTFWIHTELTASGLLLPMAATLKHMYGEMQPGEERDQMKAEASRYRHAVAQGKALGVLRSLCQGAGGFLEAYGMKICVPSPEECARAPDGVEYMPIERDSELADSISMANYMAGVDQ